MRVPHCVCPEGQGHSWHPCQLSPEGLPPTAGWKMPAAETRQLVHVKSSHEIASAVWPVRILHTGNFLDDFDEDLLS